MSDVGSYGATTWTQQLFIFVDYMHAFVTSSYMAMDQYLLIPFLGGWTSTYQLFWCSPGVQGFDTLPYIDFFNRCPIFLQEVWWFQPDVSSTSWNHSVGYKF